MQKAADEELSETGNARLNSVGEAILKFAIPFLITAGYIIILYSILPYDRFLELSGLMTVYLIPPAGKESVIPIGIALGIPWLTIAFSTAFLDIITALFLAWNFELTLKIPLIGSFIQKCISGGRSVMENYPWVEKLSFIGLVLFIMIPLQGTGGINGSIVGRMMGLNKYEVLAAIIAGSISSCVLIAIGSEYIKELFIHDTSQGMTAIAVVAVTVIILVACGIFLKRNPKNESS